MCGSMMSIVGDCIVRFDNVKIMFSQMVSINHMSVVGNYMMGCSNMGIMIN